MGFRQIWHSTRRGTAGDQLALAEWVRAYQGFSLLADNLRCASDPQAVQIHHHADGFVQFFRDTIHSHLSPFGIDSLVELMPGITGLHIDQDGNGIGIAATVRNHKGELSVLPAKQMGSGILSAAGLWTLTCGRITPAFLAIDNSAQDLHPVLATELPRRIFQDLQAETSRKQVLLVTNNLAALRGLKWKDDQVHLFRVCDHPLGGKQIVQVKCASKFDWLTSAEDAEIPGPGEEWVVG